VDVRRALISTYDKSGVAEFARRLADQGVELISTGGTAQRLRDAGLKVRTVEDVTGQPELFEGRVKTLHTNIHAAILARRDEPGDLEALADLGVDPIDLVCVNLYPFEDTVREGAGLDEAMETVDIGGPTLLRAAAKNHEACLPVVRPDRYDDVAGALETAEGPSEALAGHLAREAFQHTARYDAVIADWMAEDQSFEGFPGETALPLAKIQDLRYGENSHQQASFYRDPLGPEEPCVADMDQLHGKELSYNNVLDVNAALETVKEFEDPACVIIKHATPSGIAVADTIREAFDQAFATDTDSPYGGIIAVNREVDTDAAEAFHELFLECIIAPGYTDEAVEILTQKERVRLLEVPFNDAPRQGRSIRGVVGGAIVQDRDVKAIDPDEWDTVTEAQPTADQLEDMVFAMRCARHVKSNSVVFVKDEQTVAIGGGQTSRVDASKIATHKGGERIAGSVLASDAFFPFRDGVDVAVEAGVEAIIQPGGSIRDEEVVEAANEHGIPMVFSHQRAFLH
jgi:phosphoribosylaminoimidazolecarboxamide formyltransferase/IMP cyclohydrolase